MISIPSANPKKAAALYSHVFGIELARTYSDSVVAYHIPISDDGILFQIQQRFRDNEGTTSYFSVSDLNAEVAELERAGAKRIGGEHDMKISDRVLQPYRENYKHIYGADAHSSLGRACVLEDTDSNRICLMELHEHAHAIFKVGKHHRSVAAEHLMHHRRTLEIGKALER